MIKKITEKEYDAFFDETKGNFFQTVNMYHSRQSNYERVELLGLFVKDELQALTLLCIETLPYVNQKVGYVIMGLTIDYDDQEMLNHYVESMKEYIKKEKLVYVRYDFDRYKAQYDGDFQPTEIDERINDGSNLNVVLETAGFEFYPTKYDQFGRSPQWTMITYTKNWEEINSQINRSVKRGMKAAKKFGCEVITCSDALEKDELYGKSYLEIFYDLHEITAQRSSFVPASYEYFKDMYQNNQKYVNIYLVKLERDKFLEYTNELWSKKESPKNEKLLKLAQSIEQDYIYITGHMSSFYNKVGYDLFTGLDYQFQDLSPKELVMESVFDTCISRGIELYDYWGIIGRPDEEHHMYPIYKFKRKFSNVIVEKPGFYDLYASKSNYKMIIKMMGIRNKIKER